MTCQFNSYLHATKPLNKLFSQKTRMSGKCGTVVQVWVQQRMRPQNSSSDNFLGYWLILALNRLFCDKNCAHSETVLRFFGVTALLCDEITRISFYQILSNYGCDDCVSNCYFFDTDYEHRQIPRKTGINRVFSENKINIDFNSYHK